MAEDTAIEVVLQRSGLTFMVPPDKSILQVLIEEGIDPMYDCQRGECGICQVAVLEGVPDHRDHILSDERARRKQGDADLRVDERRRRGWCSIFSGRRIGDRA